MKHLTLSAEVKVRLCRLPLQACFQHPCVCTWDFVLTGYLHCDLDL